MVSPQTAARAAPIGGFDSRKPAYPSVRLSPVSIDADPQNAIFPSGMLEFRLYVKLDARDLSEPAPRAGVRNCDSLPGVHVGLSEDRAARLRRDPHHLRGRRDLRRVEVAEVLLG